MKNIILIGFMGCGKSSVGKYIARKNKMKQIDTDIYIERKEKRKIQEIFEQEGEEAFRDMETECIKELLLRNTDAYVISAGGGLPVREVNRQLLRKLGIIVYLKADIRTLERRLTGDRDRPLLQGGNLHDKISGLMEKRESIYEELADIIVKTDGKPFGEIEKDIMKGLMR